MPAENVHDHFTTEDRRELITTGVNLINLGRSLDEMKKLVTDGHVEIRKDADLLEARVRVLENFRWWIVGASAASGAIGSVVARYFHN